MVLEYLIQDEEQADQCVAIIDDSTPLSSKKRITDDYYIVTAYLKSDSDNSAIALSKLHEKITSSVKCTVLSDESSAYYDKIIFPVINILGVRPHFGIIKLEILLFWIWCYTGNKRRHKSWF